MTPAALADLHRRCFQSPPPWSEADFAAFVADPLAFLLVEADAAFLLGRAVAGEAEILTLAVAPESRRLGLGRRLVSRFIYQAQLRSAERAFLEVSAENAAALALYDSAGFGIEGRRKGYYLAADGQRSDALVMSRPV